MPPLVQVQSNSHVVRPAVSIVPSKPRADSTDLPLLTSNELPSFGHSDLPAFNQQADLPSFNHASHLPSFNNGASSPKSTQGHAQHDNAPYLGVQSFEDMDRKSKRMSSAVWLSDDIKQQLFLFHEDLPQQHDGTPIYFTL